MGIRNKVIMSRSSASPNGSYANTIFMRAITEQEEKSYDRLSSRDGLYFYGDIDLTKKEDLEIIRNRNIIFHDGRGMLYDNFDYEAGTFTLTPSFNGAEIEQVVRWGPCTDPVAWFKFNHCLLGKPKRVVVYNARYSELFKWR